MGVRATAARNTASIQTELKTNLAAQAKGTENLHRTNQSHGATPLGPKKTPFTTYQWLLV